MTLTRGSITLVASSRPPMPTSSTAMSTFRRAKYSNAIAVSISKKLGCQGNSPSLDQTFGGAIHQVVHQSKIVIADLLLHRSGCAH